MNNTIIITVLITSIIWITALIICYTYLKSVYLNTLKNKEIEFEKEKNLIFDKVRIEKQNEFEKGYKSANEKVVYKVQVYPHKNYIENNRFFSKDREVEIGYSYTLFVNEIPSLSPHIHIVERVKIKELNEERVNKIIENIQQLINKIPYPNVETIGNLNEFGNNLLKKKFSIRI